MSYPALTIKDLKKICEQEIKNGFGDRYVLISNDDEGNGYHGLFFGFNTDQNEIDAVADWGMFHDNVEAKSVVLLG